MSTFTLADIRAAAEKKYADVSIEVSEELTVKLINPLRLSEDRRNKLTGLQDRLNASAKGESDESQRALLEEGLCIASERDGELLVAAIDGDLTVLAATFEHYTGSVQVGEA